MAFKYLSILDSTNSFIFMCLFFLYKIVCTELELETPTLNLARLSLKFEKQYYQKMKLIKFIIIIA